MRRRSAVVLAVLLAACVKNRGGFGWYRADLPSQTGNYEERFAPLALADASCSELAAAQNGSPGRPVIVLMPGAGGDGFEMEQAVPELMRWNPASMYMLRWAPTEKRDDVAARLAAGLSRLAACLPGEELVVLCHSAGGILAGFAAAQVRAAEARVAIVTIGAPLHGIVPRPDRDDGGEKMNVYAELAHQIWAYPPPAPGVRVVHLRTHPPADISMTRIPGHDPADPSVTVPGATQFELPDGLTHEGALIYVVRAVVDGRARAWLDDGEEEPQRSSSAPQR